MTHLFLGPIGPGGYGALAHHCLRDADEVQVTPGPTGGPGVPLTAGRTGRTGIFLENWDDFE